MVYAALITLREGVEAALIIGIVLSYLARIGQRTSHRVVWAGVGVALASSVGAAALLTWLRVELPGALQEAIEGLTMLLAVGVLSWMLVWMKRQAVTLGAHLRSQVDHAVAGGSGLALGVLAFTSVGREGLETALFLVAGAARNGEGALYWGGAVAGLAGAALIGVAVYRGSARLPLGRFFDLSGAALIVLAGGLLMNATKELGELRWLPPLGPRVWDTYGVLPDNIGLGSFLSAVIGYDASPFLGQVVLYVGYLGVTAALFFAGRSQTRRDAVVPRPQAPPRA